MLERERGRDREICNMCVCVYSAGAIYVFFATVGAAVPRGSTEAVIRIWYDFTRWDWKDSSHAVPWEMWLFEGHVETAIDMWGQQPRVGTLDQFNLEAENWQIFLLFGMSPWLDVVNKLGGNGLTGQDMMLWLTMMQIVNLGWFESKHGPLGACFATAPCNILQPLCRGSLRWSCLRQFWRCRACFPSKQWWALSEIQLRL